MDDVREVRLGECREVGIRRAGCRKPRHLSNAPYQGENMFSEDFSCISKMTGKGREMKKYWGMHGWRRAREHERK